MRSQILVFANDQGVSNPFSISLWACAGLVIEIANPMSGPLTSQELSSALSKLAVFKGSRGGGNEITLERQLIRPIMPPFGFPPVHICGDQFV